MDINRFIVSKLQAYNTALYCVSQGLVSWLILCRLFVCIPKQQWTLMAHKTGHSVHYVEDQFIYSSWIVFIGIDWEWLSVEFFFYPFNQFWKYIPDGNYMQIYFKLNWKICKWRCLENVFLFKLKIKCQKIR